MATNRKAAEESILKELEMLSPGCIDVALYKERFAKMNDKAFHEFMLRLESGEEWITLTVPNNGKNNMDLERNRKLADLWGVKFHQRLWYPAQGKSPAYLTPIEFLVLPQFVRVASQRLAKKASIPKKQRPINPLTGQVTGEAKGAAISQPELRLLLGMGMEKTALELMKDRGGDQGAGMALYSSLMRHGRVSQDAIKPFATGVKSTDTVRAYFMSAHISVPK